MAETTPAGDVGRVAFIPLEANPQLMSDLLHNLGLSKELGVHDVYSLHDADMLAFVPRPALALLLVFPVSAAYESYRLAEDATTPEYAGKGDGEPVVWFRQTIRNACGLMGLLHATANGPAREFIRPPSFCSRDRHEQHHHLLRLPDADTDAPARPRTEPCSDLDKLLKEAVPLPPDQRARLLETSRSLAQAHHSAASQGDTAAPEATDDVDLHYVCFVKTADGTLWELDGRRKGPLDKGKLDEGEDVLSDKALALGPLKFLDRAGGDLRFSAVALAGSLD